MRWAKRMPWRRSRWDWRSTVRGSMCSFPERAALGARSRFARCSTGSPPRPGVVSTVSTCTIFRSRVVPDCLRCPLGARAFQTSMREVVEAIPAEVERTLENDVFKARRDAVLQRHQSETSQLLRAVEEKITAAGLTPLQVQQGPRVLRTLAYSQDDKPIPFEALRWEGDPRSKFALEAGRRATERAEVPPIDPEARRTWLDAQIDALEARTEELGRELEQTMAEAAVIQRKARKELRELPGRRFGLRVAQAVDRQKPVANIAGNAHLHAWGRGYIVNAVLGAQRLLLDGHVIGSHLFCS